MRTDNPKLLAFCDDLTDLCRKHGFYPCISQIWDLAPGDLEDMFAGVEDHTEEE